MDFNHWKGYTAQRQGNVMIHVFWDLNFLCDYLSPNGLFYNSVSYLILLNKILLILTKRGSRWHQKKQNNELTLKPRTVQFMLSVCAVYCICIAAPVLLRPVRNTHYRFEMNFFWRKV